MYKCKQTLKIRININKADFLLTYAFLMVDVLRYFSFAGNMLEI